MEFEAWEQQIIDALTPALPEGVAAIKMPETPDEWQRDYQDARILVGFNNVKWHKDMGLSVVDQTAEIEFGIIIQANLLRGAKGVYDLFKTIQKNVVGMTLAGCKRMRSDDFKLYNDNDGQFVFVYFVNCDCMQAPYIFDEEESATVRIARITADEEILYSPLDANKTENNAVIDIIYTPPEI